MEENQIIEASGQVPPAVQEKTLTQSEVNQIVAREKQQATEKARAQLEQEFQQRMMMQQQQSQSQGQSQQQPQGYNAPHQADADALYQQVQERFNRDQQLLKDQLEQRDWQNHANEIANSYQSKMEAGAKAYEDFGDVTKSFDATEFPQLVYLLANMDNAADMVYEISKNPSKLVTLDALAQRSPKMAQAELLKLSQSIAANNTARQEADNSTTYAPLDSLQPSRVSGSNGKMTIRDLRNQDWLKG